MRVKVTLKTGKVIEVLPREVIGLQKAGLLKEEKTSGQTKEEKAPGITKEEKNPGLTKEEKSKRGRPANISKKNIKK